MSKIIYNKYKYSQIPNKLKMTININKQQKKF